MRKLTAGLSKKQLIYLLIIFTGMSSAILIYNLCRTLDKDGDNVMVEERGEVANINNESNIVEGKL